ncbi:DUF429 domain-containing protein [Xanthomonas cannabis]|uniref:DUF429 domain-containing protein n=1 Tax=Xanthomonas cannabis TaxID=1885674 RepID=UPI00141B821F|nr:putative RNase H-like nuclease [Xanthomonas cannabis]
MQQAWCVGVDGARSGWIAVWDNGDLLAFTYYPSVAALAVALPAVDVLGVDIPIGLSEHAPRAADAQARRFVGGRRACSIFAAPLRGILQARTQAEASALHRVLDHEKQRGFGVQSFALLPKIRDWDDALRADPAWAALVFEVHPEVSFAALAGGPGLAAAKKSSEGQRQRCRLLGDHYGAARVASLLERVPRACAQPDDVLDALAACWSAQRIAAGTAGSLPAVVERDACGLRMGIYF